MTNTWVHGVEVNFCNATSILSSECLQDPLLAKKGNPSDELAAGCGNGQRDGAVTNDFPMSLEDHVSRAEKPATWEPECDVVSDEGSYPSVASSGSTDTDAGEWSYAEEYEHRRGHVVDVGVSGGSVASFDTGSFESCDVAEDAGPLAGSKLLPCGGGLNGVDKLTYGLELQQDGGGEFFDTEESPVWARPSPSQCSPSSSPQKNVRSSEGSGNVLKPRLHAGLSIDPCSPISHEVELDCADDVVSANFSRSEESACETGVSTLKKQLGKVVAMADANGTSSSYASFLQPNEQVLKSCRRGDTDGAFRDLEAGLETGSHLLNRERRKVQERSFYDKDLVAELLTSGSLRNHASGNDFGKVLLSHIPEHELNNRKDVSSRADGRSNGHVAENEDGEISGLRRRRGGRVPADIEGTKAVQSLANSASLVSSLKDSPSENGHEVRRSEKKGAKQTKARLTSLEKEVSSMASVKSVSGVRRPSNESPSAEELRAKEQAENDRKVQESLDNFIRQTMGREPYMSFPGRTDRSMPRLHRPEVLDPLIASKISKGVKLDLDMRDNGAEDNSGNTADLDSFRESSSGSIKAGLGRGLPISGDRMNPLKVPQAVVAFAQAAAKASDQLPGWPLMSPSPKVQMQKCQKCSREFCSVINYRRHIRTHKKIFDSDKEDWSKERPKIGSFWDKLSPKDGRALLKTLMEDSDDYSGGKVVKSLSIFLQQAPVLSLPAAYQKAGAALLEIVQSSSEETILSAEKLFGMLDDASEKTFLIGSTDPKDQKVFSGDERVGLEDKNLVSFLGFLLEQKLMRAWMKDKDEEALKCQQALVAEEEAAQQKLAKTQEKKRLRKAKKGLKERERKESALALPGTDTPLLENTSMVQGVGLQEDSPRSGPSSVGSSAEITELGGHFDRRDDEEVGASQVDSALDDGTVGAVEVPEVVTESLQAGTNSEDSSSGDAENPDLALVVDKLLPLEDSKLEEKAEVVAGEEVSDHDPGHQVSPVQVDLDVGSKAPRLEQERPTMDYKRREGDRNFTDRKFSRPARPRTEYDDGMGLSGYGNRPVRGTDVRYWENPGQGVFKPVRKTNSGTMHSGRADSGTGMVPESSQTRVQHFRTKSGGRSSMPAGVQHGVWTVKASQPAAGEHKEKKDEDCTNEISLAKTSSSEQLDEKDAGSATEAASTAALDLHEDKELVSHDEREATVASFSEDTSTIPLVPAAFNLDVNPGDWPRLPQKTCTQGSAATSEPSRQNAGPLQPKESSPAAVARAASTQADDTVSHARLENQQGDGMSGALLVGSLTVPLGNFGVDSSCPSNRGAMLVESLGMASIGPGPTGAKLQDGSTTSEAVSNSGVDGFAENLEIAGYQSGVVGRPSLSANTSPKHFRPHANTAGERGENSRHTGMPLSRQERLAKQGSWPTGANRFGTAKVWRAVGVVGDGQEPSNSGSVLGSDTFPRNRDVPDEQEGAGVETSSRIELKSAGCSASLDGGTAVADDVDEVPEPSTGGSEEQFCPRPLLVVDDRVREYVAMLSEFNRIRWEEAQRDPEGWRDLEAAEYVVEETEKVDFSEVILESKEAWLKSIAGGQVQCLSEEASVAPCVATTPEDESEQAMSHTADGEGQCQVASGSEGCIDDELAPHSQHVTDVAVTSEEGVASTETDAQGFPERTDPVRVGSTGAVSGTTTGVQGRGSSRQERRSNQTQKERPHESSGGLRYIARRR